MPRPTLVIIDGHSLLYRGFYATRPLTTSDGRPTNAVYAFTNMLLSMLEQFQPDAIVAAFDAPAPTFRHEAFTEYKAHRRETPDEFRPQVEMTRRLLEAMGAPTLSEEGFEADDLVGALARYAVQHGYEVLIFTGDRDQLQLINEHVRVFAPIRGVSELQVFDADAVRQKYGLNPAQIVDFKALCGDPSDNIPGVPGVGEKTAVKLLQQFGSVENLLAHLDQVEPEKLREAIRAHTDQIRQSRMLATILDNAPLPLTEIPRLELTPERAQALHRVLEEYEFRSILKRLPALIGRYRSEPTLTPVQSVYETLTPEVLRHPDEATLARLLEGDAPVGVRIVGSLHRLRDATIEGVALAVAPDRAAWLDVQGSLFLPEPLARLLSDPQRVRIAWDIKTEWLLLRGAGVEATPASFDALLAAYLWQPSRATYALEWLSEDLLSMRLPDETHLRPAAEACALTLMHPRLRDILQREQTLNVLEQLEIPLAPILAEMEWHGVRLDAPYLQELSTRLAADIDAVAHDIYTLAGETFNIASPKQLGVILFEKLGLPVVKKTKTGYSTDAEVLQTLAAEHPIAALIVKHRELSKLRSTYAEALPKLINPLTGRIHTKLNQTVTATGRLSSSEPNLQNIPIRTEIGREIRRAFVAAPNYTLLSLDYSQIELRILAHMSGDPMLMQAFERGEDIHTATASILFGLPPEQVDKELRRRAKTVNYAVLYGMSDYGLSQELGIGVGEAKTIIEQYFQRFPQIRAFTQSILDEARATGYVRTLLGRKRYIPELQSANRNERLAAERAAINMPFQGTAADIMKLAMLRVHQRLPLIEPRTRMLLQVHDELLLETPDAPDALDAITHAIRAEMEQAYPLRVPLTVEAKVGPNWRDMMPT
ncbi:MAG: DNA polymerase I [Fimbriimonadales bacterium]